MSPSITSEISIDVATSTEPNHPTFFREVIIQAAVSLGNMVMLLMLTVAGFFNGAFIFLIGASLSLGDMVMLLVLTVAGFFKDGFILLLAQLDDDVNHARNFFILASLIGFAGVKAQAVTGFPFDKHEMFIKCSITSLLFFGFACFVTQYFVPPSYKRIIRLAEIAEPNMSRLMSSVC